MHDLVSVSVPTHGLPSSLGAGLSQRRVRRRDPSPHETEQRDQLDQNDHWPFANRPHHMKNSSGPVEHHTLHTHSNKSQSKSESSRPLPAAGQHAIYGDCVEVKREYYQNSSVLDCVTQCSQSAAHLCEQFLQVKQIGFVTLGPLWPIKW